MGREPDPFDRSGAFWLRKEKGATFHTQCLCVSGHHKRMCFYCTVVYSE